IPPAIDPGGAQQTGSSGASPAVSLGVRWPRNGNRLMYTRRRACPSVAGPLAYGWVDGLRDERTGEERAGAQPKSIECQRADTAGWAYPGSRVNLGVWTGRATEKSRTSVVITSVTRIRSATATTEASAAPKGRS